MPDDSSQMDFFFNHRKVSGQKSPVPCLQAALWQIDNKKRSCGVQNDGTNFAAAAFRFFDFFFMNCYLKI